MPSERTITNLRLQGEPLKTPGYLIWDCGCMDRGAGRWVLCQYHEGFDDAAEQADELQALIDAYAATQRNRAWLMPASLNNAEAALLAAATTDDADGR